MANINFDNYAGWDLPVYLNRLNAIPLDKDSLYYSFADAQEYANDTTKNGYVGQLLSVVVDDEVTIYKIGTNRQLEEVGKGNNVETVSGYTTAKENFATDENVGKIINVTNDETIDDTTYSKGLYIVTGNDTLARIATTTATGDLAKDVLDLQTVVNAGLYWETDGIID